MTRQEHGSLELSPDDADDGPHADRDSPASPLTPLQVAGYIESMALELKVMARGARLDTLCYFLDMTRVEATAEIERLAAEKPERRAASKRLR